MRLRSVGGIDELELIHHLRETIDLARVDAERLPHFARRARAAIGDDVGRHRGAEPAVFLVNVLNHPLAAIAARQIEVDVGPLAAFLQKETLEQQIHADGIDGGDAQAVADGAVGRRAAALHEDVVVPAEIHDVPDDQEIAGEIETLDEIELARNLRAGAIVIRTIALAGAEIGQLAEKRQSRLRPAAPDNRETGTRDRPSCNRAARQAPRSTPAPRADRGTAVPSLRAASDSARRCAPASFLPAPDRSCDGCR